jgi:hypothetical protein
LATFSVLSTAALWGFWRASTGNGIAGAAARAPINAWTQADVSRGFVCLFRRHFLLFVLYRSRRAAIMPAVNLDCDRPAPVPRREQDNSQNRK